MKILLGYDGSQESRNALAEVIKLGRVLSADVCVFTSVEGGQHAVREIYEGFESALSSAKKAIADAGVPCEGKLSALGLEPGEEMIQFAREIEADLIVIGVKKRSRVNKLMFGSNAQFVILEADCPVLSVK
jgi:nucleotide-binding universal stress UspA family protein